MLTFLKLNFKNPLFCACFPIRCERMRVFLNQVRPECNLLQHPRLLSVPLPIRLPRQWNTLCLWVPIACNLNLVLVECSGATKLTLWLMKRIVLFSRFSWRLYYTTFKKMPPFDNVLQNLNMQCCERFEPRSHFKSRLRLISRVNVVLNRTVVVDSDWRFDPSIVTVKQSSIVSQIVILS